MSRYSLNEFISTSSQKERGQGTFELESPHLLEVKLNGRIWTKVGTMIGYLGNVTFKREDILEHGLGNLMKKMVSGEGMSLMKMDGEGQIYLADKGKRIHMFLPLINLDREINRLKITLLLQ